MLNLSFLTRQGYDTTTPIKAIAALMAYVAKRPQAPMMAYAQYISEDVSPHFIGQAMYETEGMRFCKELWGPTDAQKHYEGRGDLGNTQLGDGFKFRGRGIFQVTGRANYAHMAKVLNLPLLDHPELLEMPEHAVASALSFWNERGLGKINTGNIENDCRTITHHINGGENGLQDRLLLTRRVFDATISP